MYSLASLAKLTLSLLMLSVRLTIDKHSTFSSNHVAILAKLLYGGSYLEASGWDKERWNSQKVYEFRGGIKQVFVKDWSKHLTLNYGSKRQHNG